MTKTAKRYVCLNCGYISSTWFGRCPSCGSWGSLEEEHITKQDQESFPCKANRNDKPLLFKLSDIDANIRRYSTGLGEVDRVLGGGIVEGSVILISGEPGIGKSTLLLQISSFLSKKHPVLYISGEESESQIFIRFSRLGCPSVPENLIVFPNNRMDLIKDALSNRINEVSFIIIDSVQSVYDPAFGEIAGTPTQVRAVTEFAVTLAKQFKKNVFVVGHITKEGLIAGPKLLEHMVDVVLYFEGDRNSANRLLRAVKNRYGSTDEIGLLEMTEHGLVSVDNPFSYLVDTTANVQGSVIASIVEGNRPLFVEVQALVSRTCFQYPKRVSLGIPLNKLMLLLAVMEKRCGLKSLRMSDVYVSVSGGLNIKDPSVDVAVCVAVASSMLDVVVSKEYVFSGEVGLAGTIKPPRYLEKRLKDAFRLGFKRFFVAKAFKAFDIKTYNLTTLKELFFELGFYKSKKKE